MQSQWHSHLKNQADKDNFEQLVLGSTKVLDRLREILYNRLQAQESSVDYDSPSWAYHQADKLGQAKVLKDMIKLLDFSDKE